MADIKGMSAAEQLFAETEMIARAANFGLPVNVDPDVADHMGAFEETAINGVDADESRFDVDLDTGIVIDDPIDGETAQ